LVSYHTGLQDGSFAGQPSKARLNMLLLPNLNWILSEAVQSLENKDSTVVVVVKTWR
jgi:hypothetical protein